MRASVCLALLLSVGCDQLWGTYVQPNPQNCVTSGNACGAGTTCNRTTGSCDPPTSTGSPKPGPVCNPGGFCWENPLPQGNDLNRAWGRTTSDVWFVGAYGTLLHCEVPVSSSHLCYELLERRRIDCGSIPQALPLV